MKRYTRYAAIALSVLIFMIPTQAMAWTQVTSDYNYLDDDDVSGGGWTTYRTNPTNGEIKIEHDQVFGTAYCHVYMGHKITTPSYGTWWIVAFKLKHRLSYAVGGRFGTFTIVIKAELHDANHGVDYSFTTHYIYNLYGNEEDTTKSCYRIPAIWYEPDTDVFVVLHVYIVFSNTVWMVEHPSSGYSTARFDLMYLYYEFRAAGGGDPPEF